jgi:hypothetical protein
MLQEQVLESLSGDAISMEHGVAFGEAKSGEP